MALKNTSPNSGHRKRLKEKFLKSSLDGFHDYETVELLLTYAIPRRDVKPLAKELLGRFKGLKGLFEASNEELAALSGVGENTAVLISLIREVAGAYLNEQAARSKAIRAPEDVMDFLRFVIGNGGGEGAEDAEKLIAIYLNSKNEVLGFEVLMEGMLKQDTLTPRTVIETAFKYNARSMIFVHSLSSGKAAPTGAEKDLVEALERSASAVDILIHDHIVAGKDTHLSAREIGWLKGA